MCAVSPHCVVMQHRMLFFCLISRVFCTREPADGRTESDYLHDVKRYRWNAKNHFTGNQTESIYSLLWDSSIEDCGLTWLQLVPYPVSEEPQLCKATGPSGTICRAHGSASYEPPWEMSRFQWGKWYSSSCASSGLNVAVHRHMVTVISHNRSVVLQQADYVSHITSSSLW